MGVPGQMEETQLNQGPLFFKQTNQKGHLWSATFQKTPSPKTRGESRLGGKTLGKSAKQPHHSPNKVGNAAKRFEGQAGVSRETRESTFLGPRVPVGLEVDPEGLPNPWPAFETAWTFWFYHDVIPSFPWLALAQRN